MDISGGCWFLSSSSVVGLVVGVEQNISLECVRVKNLNWHFILRARHTTIRGTNLIKWCQWEHLLDRILKGLRVRGAGLKLFMVSIDDLVCQLCIGCSLSLINKGTKLCVITDILFGLSYFLTGSNAPTPRPQAPPNRSVG
jgi:hypothetical protein